MNRESGLASYRLAPVKNKTFLVEWSNHPPARVGYYYQSLFKCNRVNKKKFTKCLQLVQRPWQLTQSGANSRQFAS